MARVTTYTCDYCGTQTQNKHAIVFIRYEAPYEYRTHTQYDIGSRSKEWCTSCCEKAGLLDPKERLGVTNEV